MQTHQAQPTPVPGPVPGIDWPRIATALAAHFPPEVVEWRPQGKPAPNKRVQIVAYIDARAVQDRLDAVVGPGAWSFELEPLVIDAGELRVARGRLSIHGVSKDDIGTASNWEPSKGCASDALKRAGCQWGIARYLYGLPAIWVMLDEHSQVPAAQLAKLREALARRQSQSQVSGAA